MHYKLYLQRAVLVVTATLLALFLGELLLRLLLPEPKGMYVWQPNLQHTFTPDTGIFYGIHGSKQFTINSQGLRGDELESDALNFVCIGGSTTECLYLDDHETWWYKLQQRLNKNSEQKVIIASLGKSGVSSRENYLHVKYVAANLPHLTGLFVMTGLNDLMRRLSRDSLFEPDFRFTPQVEDSMVQQIFLHPSSPNRVWYRNLRLFKLVQNALHQNKGVRWELQDDNGALYKQLRKKRSEATALLDTLPDLTDALNEYERNLQGIIDVARKHQLQLVFINQAAIYRDSMNSFEQSLFWMGGKGDFQAPGQHYYYTTRALHQALNQYNQHLAKVCLANHIPLIDLAGQLPSDTSVFYDDCHFHEAGAIKVAEIITKSFGNGN